MLRIDVSMRLMEEGVVRFAKERLVDFKSSVEEFAISVKPA
jgi:hypothetical protein